MREYTEYVIRMRDKVSYRETPAYKKNILPSIGHVELIEGVTESEL